MPVSYFRTTTAACALTFSLSTLLLPQEPKAAGQQGRRSERAVQEVLRMKRDYDSALIRGDSRWFEGAFADDYMLIVGDSKSYRKADIVSQLASREIVWKSAVGRDMKVRIYGDTAVVTGRFTGQWLQNGKPLAVDERFTSVWVRDGVRWKAVSEHTSDIPAQ